MPAASDMTDWNVIFRTGHGQGAGTDSNIFLQITDKMFIKSPIVKFDGALKGTFERKSKDKFSFKLPTQYKVRFQARRTAQIEFGLGVLGWVL